MDICVDVADILLITSNEYILNAYCKAKDRGIKIRIITDITPSSISYSKKIISIAGEVRHMNGLIGSFGTSEKDYISTDISPFGTTSQRAIHCNIKAFVQKQQYFFIIWKKAVVVEQKIQEIERGIKVEKIETITDPSEIESTYVQLLYNATNEILLIVPTSNSMNRQLNIGIFNY